MASIFSFFRALANLEFEQALRGDGRDSIGNEGTPSLMTAQLIKASLIKDKIEMNRHQIQHSKSRFAEVSLY